MAGADGDRSPATCAEPAAGVRLVASQEEAGALAHRLLLPGRRCPTVVLTIAGGHDEPFADSEEIKEAVGDLAEVVLMPTSEVSRTFARVMPPMTQVYGGACRVYPIDHAWVSDPSHSRLRFAYSPQDRRRVTELLINDALQAALAGGMLALRTRPGLRRLAGTVAGVIGSRALVTLDDGAPATVWEELTVPGVPLDRVVVKGQRVVGSFDPVSRRLDLRGELRYVEADDGRAAVLDAYRAGDVVLADVADVTEDAVTLRLVPGFSVRVGRAAVTSNPNDTLPDLFILGEVVLGRVVGTGPFALRLDDIDDDEEPRPAPSLLPDGPPWLRPAQRDPQPPAPAPARPADPAPPPANEVSEPPRRPSPLDIARRSPGAVTPSAPPAPLHPSHAESLAKQRTRITELTNELAAERATREGLSDELERLRDHAAGLEADLNRARRLVEDGKTRYRKADLARQMLTRQLKAERGRPEPAPGGPLFPDPEDQFRYDVYCEWAHRVPAAEKAGRPLAEYVLLPGFLDSVERVEGVSRSKIVAVVVEVLTGQAPHLPGRDAHQLREGAAGSRYLTREDGATCWRVALQQDTPAARRLHYWRKADTYQFSRVALHDDYRP
jgi:hypothetical protein